jgi:predicted glycogen debranching enzyme
LLSGRDFHALMRENEAFDFRARVVGGNAGWRPYAELPPVAALSSGDYVHEPDWYRNFLYALERERGLDCVEDLASPGTVRFDLAQDDAVLVLRADTDIAVDARTVATRVHAAEAARRSPLPPLEHAATCYFARRGDGTTIMAGYPWFGEWGRDTFIALRGLALAGRRFVLAQSILLAWSATVSAGMLPNRFPDRGEAPEYNAVDASLWYVVAVHELLEAGGAGGDEARRLEQACREILAGYAAGTRYGIRLDDDGLLAAGVPGWQLTWMDARVGDHVVTPRIGKPVEVQALWLNALAAARRWTSEWEPVLARGRRSFAERFWNAGRGHLHDVVDTDHQPGVCDPRLRPNQIFAVGGLPLALLEGPRARRVVDAVERALWTPLGLRSLAPGERGYAGRYAGGPAERDGAYHQGTVWPWLLGPFVEAWVRVRGATPAVKDEARRRFLAPLQAHLAEAGLGHVSEIADADAPHAPNGCPFQAWSLGELLRLERRVLA